MLKWGNFEIPLPMRTKAGTTAGYHTVTSMHGTETNKHRRNRNIANLWQGTQLNEIIMNTGCTYLAIFNGLYQVS